jgi:hypothetical protein
MDVVERARQRIDGAAEGRMNAAAFDAALEQARDAVEALAQTTAGLEAGLPAAIQDGMREQFRPSARHLAEIRGLMNHVVRRMERLEGDLLAERHARVDDLGLLVDLISSGWKSVNDRLARIEAALPPIAEVVELKREPA